MPNTRENLFAPQLMPMGAITYAIACSHCKNRGADAKKCNQCKCEVKSWFELDTATVQKWIPVTERLPEVETEVLILASRKIYSLKSRSHTTHYIITTGMYEDGTKHTEDSEWWWEADGFEYDEERDDYIIPEGWWEYKHYNGDEQHNYAVDDTVTHWMYLPEAPKGE